MKLGLQIVRFDWLGTPDNTGQVLSEVAKTADRAGFSSLWCMDHFYQIGIGHGSEDSPMHESYTNLSFMAAETRNVKLGTMVTGSFYRQPGVLVKTVTTLDVLSGGRGMLGIGAGWYELESRGMGVPFPHSVKERMGRFEETLKIAHYMWSDDRTSFEGKYYRLEEPICSPQPVSRPHPYIMIGGSGERKTLRYVAKYGDACNLHLGAHPKLGGYSDRSYVNYRTRKERLGHKLDVLRRHCESVGRDYEEIDKSVLSPVEFSPEALTTGEVVGMCRELSEMGFNYVVFNMPNDHEITPIEAIGEEVIPEVRDM